MPYAPGFPRMFLEGGGDGNSIELCNYYSYAISKFQDLEVDNPHLQGGSGTPSECLGDTPITL